MMRPVHLRMARAALGWTLKELAERAGINMNTISRYEAGAEVMSGTLEKIEDVLRLEGVVFIDEDADYLPAIKIRREVPPPLRDMVLQLESPDIRPFALKPRVSKTKRRANKKPRLNSG